MLRRAFSIAGLQRKSDGVYEGIAIGGDRYPVTTFMDHLMRYQANPDVKIIVLLGEVGGTDEYDVVEALRDGRITKPLVAWTIGSCAQFFPAEIQFGHAGARAGSERESAAAKNAAFRDAGALVPESFDEFDAAIRGAFEALILSTISAYFTGSLYFKYKSSSSDFIAYKPSR